MSTREQLEKDVKKALDRLRNAPADTPDEVIKQWREELDALSFQLDNLYDDQVNEYTN